MKSTFGSSLGEALEASCKTSSEDDAAPGAIDAQGDPLEIMRALLANVTTRIDKMRKDHPGYNKAMAEARALTKAVASLERERARVETPEEALARKRRESGEVRRLIFENVERAERRAAEQGVCCHCGQKRTT